MNRIPFDVTNPDFALLRQVILDRLRAEPDWKQMDTTGEGLLRYIELTPARPTDRRDFVFMAHEVFWDLMREGVVAPGADGSNLQLPHFHVTQYGRKVLAHDEYVAHEPTGYITLLQQRVSPTDPTVLAYVGESLNTFAGGNLVASTVMLGVAAERVFDLLCESLLAALSSEHERRKFSELLARFGMKPKVDWVHAKLREIQDRKPRHPGIPENAALMVTAVYDMIRLQRNELGHPRESPPRLSHGDAHANLLVFPRYYETAEAVRKFFASNTV
jgi:hypothetical protein